MSKRNHRSGGKFGGTHTTIIPTAAIMADAAVNLALVSKVNLGLIKGGLPPVNDQQRVKFTAISGALLLSVRANTSHQQLRIYTSHVPQVRLALARTARDAGLNISFAKKDKKKSHEHPRT